MDFDKKRSMPLVPCPTCRKMFDPQHTAAMPFCSVRCRQIDLGRWFNEENSLPAASHDEGDMDWDEEVLN